MKQYQYPNTKALSQQGFCVIDEVYSADEIQELISVIDLADSTGDTFRKTDDLFAIRQFLKEVPTALPVIFNNKLKSIINGLFGDDYFVSKSIYFDKPQKSNWFVVWHRDLTISVDKRVDLPGFTNWTVKSNQFAVQPPFSILADNFTIRIHLDDTDDKNGALKVIPESHIFRELSDDTEQHKEVVCDVKSGGVMIMRPLIMHASNRTVNNKRRRVIHIEFSRSVLPQEIQWSEKIEVT